MQKRNKSIVLFGINVLAGVASLVLVAWALYAAKRSATHDLKKVALQKNLIPVAIIGGGPAGLSAAVYTARSQIKTIVFAGFQQSGQLAQVKHIENWPSRDKVTGGQIIKDLEAQAKKFGAVLLYEQVKSADLSTWPFKLVSNEGTECYALSVIIATGSQAKRLNIPGVEEYLGKGVSSCAICDAPFNKDQHVVVVGGSDTAAELALQVAAYAKKVTMIVREPALQACATVQDYLLNCKNLTILYSTLLEEVKGDGSAPVSVRVRDSATRHQQEIPAKAVYLWDWLQANI